MIVFDLRCGGGHVFEAWFGSTADYDDQRARGLVSCPLCGDGDVAKAVMAPSISAKGDRSVALAGGGDAAKAKAMLHALARAQSAALKGSAWVGDRFAVEARAMHEGERDAAPIHGRATTAEARALAEDGVPVAPLPLPVRPPEQDN